MVSIGYIIRLCMGHKAVACDTVPEAFGSRDLIRYETTGPAPCTIVFLLIYFFGMASSLWWVILAFTWFLRYVALRAASSKEINLVRSTTLDNQIAPVTSKTFRVSLQRGSEVGAGGDLVLLAVLPPRRLAHPVRQVDSRTRHEFGGRGPDRRGLLRREPEPDQPARLRARAALRLPAARHVFPARRLRVALQDQEGALLFKSWTVCC